MFGKNNSQGQNGRTVKLKRLHESSEKDINLCTRYPARETYNWSLSFWVEWHCINLANQGGSPSIWFSCRTHLLGGNSARCSTLRSRFEDVSFKICKWIVVYMANRIGGLSASPENLFLLTVFDNFLPYSGFSWYHEDDMAYGGLCQWSCVHHRRRRHRQTLRVSLCQITINL